MDDPAWRVAAASGLESQFDAWLASNRLTFVSCSESRQHGPLLVAPMEERCRGNKSSSSRIIGWDTWPMTQSPTRVTSQMQEGEAPEQTVLVAPMASAMTEVEDAMTRAARGLLNLTPAHADNSEAMGEGIKGDASTPGVPPLFPAAASSSPVQNDSPVVEPYFGSPSGGHLSAAIVSAPTVDSVLSSQGSLHLFRPDVE